MYDTTITVRTNSNTKKSAQELFANLGMDMSTAFNMFLKKAVSYRGIPFEVTEEEPNAETLVAISDAMSDKNMDGPYKNATEMLEAPHAKGA